MMFYTQLFTSKRGPLAKIWLAAHWERKLTKAHVFECNLETTINDIISPQIKIGLRTSGHLLLGVVRIYSRKAKYLLADCSDALVKIKMAFRPGQTDLPLEGLEATIKEITLVEDFTAFDSQLPHPSDIDAVEHFSQNQSRSEEITLKEDFGNGFLNLADIGDESPGHTHALLDMSLQSFTQHGDAFGDEDQGFDLLDFLTNSTEHAELTNFNPEEKKKENQENSSLNYQQDADRGDALEAETPTPNETTLLANEDEAFALEPVAVTPNSERKRSKRKRKLVVDETKELSNDFIREQMFDFSDLVAPLDMAPPTVQLMLWKETGGADKLFAQPCCAVATPEIKELFAESIFPVKHHGACEEVEERRHEGQEAQRDLGALATDVSVVDSSIDAEKTRNSELTVPDRVSDNRESYSQLAQDGNRSEFAHPELPSEDSMFVHPSYPEEATPSTSFHTQSMLNSQDFEERWITRRAQRLLSALKQRLSISDPTFSLEALCEGSTRSQAATTFFCLLVLKKQQVLQLHQSAPYGDIIVTPAPKFYE